jgi:hypothetical protein
MKRILLIVFLLAIVSVRGEFKDSKTRTSDLIPSNYTVSQNYPNPFNPETNVRIYIDKEEYVTLKIYNIIGQEVKTAVAEDMAKGEHVVKINANDLTGGVYFYTIRAGEFTKTMRMILLK